MYKAGLGGSAVDKMTDARDPRWLEKAKEIFADCALIGTNERIHKMLIERFAQALQDAYELGRYDEGQEGAQDAAGESL